MDDLKRLIERRLRELNVQANVAAAEARAAGHQLTNQRLSQFINTKISQVPYRHTLEALAYALKVPVELVGDAALRSLGVSIPPRVNAVGENVSLCTHNGDCETRPGEPRELTLVLRVEGLSAEILQQLIQTVSETALREGQRITQSSQSEPTASSM